MGKRQLLAVAESTTSLLALLIKAAPFTKITENNSAEKVTDTIPVRSSENNSTITSSAKNSKESILSYIFCGNILVQAPSSHATQYEAQLEVLRDHKRIVRKGSQIFFQVNNDFVSRGGQKLEQILDTWNISVDGKICLDCGASTGGFSDCLLTHKAQLVYAVDVGYNQLHYSLQVDKRVISLERTNVLSLRNKDFSQGQPQMAVIDLSFRSLCGVLAFVQSLVQDGHCLALCKPQFERKQAERKLDLSFKNFSGVVDQADLLKILIFVVNELDTEGVYVQRILPAGITGRKGNQEFFFETKRTCKFAAKTKQKNYLEMCEKALKQV